MLAQTPARVLDTRNGTGGYSTPVGPGGTISLQVTGAAGVPASGVTAVVLNVTTVDPTAGGYVSVYPDGQPRPVASNLDFAAGQTIANLVQVAVRADGKADFYNLAGSVNLVADLYGYYTTGSSLGVRRFSYDAYGRAATATDGAGRAASYGYDTQDRLTSISYSDGTPAVTFGYDGSGNLIQRTDASGITTDTYDLANRLLSRANTASGKTLTYTYDPVGNLTSVDDGRGLTSYTYDSRNLLSSMTTGNGTLYTFGYDNDGRRTATYFNTVAGNTTWTTRTTTSYDKSTAARNSDPANLIFDTSYCYSPFVSGQSCPTGSASTDTGLLQYTTDHLTGTVSVDTYDKAGRLTGATNAAGHTYGYTYDGDGNRTSVTTDGATTQSLSFNSANQITSTGYGYDTAGNLTTAPGGTAYTYNAAGQMTRATVNGTTSGHVYAGPGQRELTSAAGNQFVWGRADQYGQPWLQSYNTNSTTQAYIERDGAGTPLGLHSAGNDYTTILDNLGSVVAVAAKNGTIAARYSYDPYGTAATADESGLDVQPNVIRYTGGTFDQTTGLTKLGQRYYNPTVGAFTQQDTTTLLTSPQNGNLYAYAADNPANLSTPPECAAAFWVRRAGSYDCGGVGRSWRSRWWRHRMRSGRRPI